MASLARQVPGVSLTFSQLPVPAQERGGEQRTTGVDSHLTAEAEVRATWLQSRKPPSLPDSSSSCERQGRIQLGSLPRSTALQLSLTWPPELRVKPRLELVLLGAGDPRSIAPPPPHTLGQHPWFEYSCPRPQAWLHPLHTHTHTAQQLRRHAWGHPHTTWESLNSSASC